MSYGNPRAVITYTLPAVDFGAGDSAHAIKAPYGYARGRLLDVGVAVTETFNQVTTPGYVRVGTSGDADAYAELNMAAAAATNYYNTDDDTDAIIEPDIADGSTQLEVACIAPTGGTPAGIGTVHITIAWE
jgi:hypothetical protein